MIDSKPVDFGTSTGGIVSCASSVVVSVFFNACINSFSVSVVEPVDSSFIFSVEALGLALLWKEMLLSAGCLSDLLSVIVEIVCVTRLVVLGGITGFTGRQGNLFRLSSVYFSEIISLLIPVVVVVVELVVVSFLSVI